MRKFRIDGEELGSGRWRITLEGHDPVFTVAPASTVEAMTSRIVRQHADIVLPTSNFLELQEEGQTTYHMIALEDSAGRSPLGPVGRKVDVSDGRRSGAVMLKAEITGATKSELNPAALKSVEEWEERYGSGSARPRPVWIYTITKAAP